MTAELELVSARNRAIWRRWLERNHESSRGIWLEFYKKHTGKPTVTYHEALDEALCFGWIDSIVKRIDDERCMRKFTPRTNPKNWSPTNLRHMRRLISEGRMTGAGLAVLGVTLGETETTAIAGKARKQTGEEVTVPEYIESTIASNPRAARFWHSLAPGYRRRYLGWILHAKGEATRKRRLAEAVRCLAAGTKSILQ